MIQSWYYYDDSWVMNQDEPILLRDSNSAWACIRYDVQYATLNTATYTQSGGIFASSKLSTSTEPLLAAMTPITVTYIDTVALSIFWVEYYLRDVLTNDSDPPEVTGDRQGGGQVQLVELKDTLLLRKVYISKRTTCD